MSEQLYYIQHHGHFAYDYILWWGKNSIGYTYNLANAGLYTEDQAKSIVGVRGEEAAWKKEDVEAAANMAVDITKLRGLGYKADYDRPPPVTRKPYKPCPRCAECGRIYSHADQEEDPNSPYCKVCR